MIRIAVIGGGPAGMIAAYSAAQNGGAKVVLFEKNPVVGKKLSITGKGRCNLTNTASPDKMRDNILRGDKFLISALHAFDNRALCDFFTARGVPLKTERGGRVFPVSDKAGDIVRALADAVREKVQCRLSSPVLSIERQDASFTVRTATGDFSFDRVILATGGVSYPMTGSTGDGYTFAKDLGHTVHPPRPALVGLNAKDALCREAMGLTLKNCAVRVETEQKKKVFEGFGEVLFTHFGLSGPVILSASSALDFDKEKTYRVILDLKPALDEKTLDRRLCAELEKNARRDWINSLSDLLPQKLIAPMVKRSGIDPHKKTSELSRQERLSFGNLLKRLVLTVTDTRPIREAIVTRGGVDLSEINPHTMQSRLVCGLFFAGEVIDADALTGGFNLQIAFSTGVLAGKSAVMENA